MIWETRVLEINSFIKDGYYENIMLVFKGT